MVKLSYKKLLLIQLFSKYYGFIMYLVFIKGIHVLFLKIFVEFIKMTLVNKIT